MDKRLPTRNEVLDFMGSDDRAFHAKEIAANLDVSDASYNGLLAVLDNLVFDGVLIAGDGHRFKLTSAQPKAARHHEAGDPARAPAPLRGGSASRGFPSRDAGANDKRGSRDTRGKRDAGAPQGAARAEAPRVERDGRDRREGSSRTPRGEEREGILTVARQDTRAHRAQDV